MALYVSHDCAVSNEHKLFGVENSTIAKQLFPIRLLQNGKPCSDLGPPAEHDNGQTTSHFKVITSNLKAKSSPELSSVLVAALTYYFKSSFFQIFAQYTQSVVLGLFVEATCSPKEKDLFLKSFQNPLKPLAFWSVSEKQANEEER